MSDLVKGIQDMTLEWLYSTVAAKLARRPVKVLWSKIPDARGQVFKSCGKYYLQIDPSLDHEQRLKTFLHECAHLRLHHEHITDQSEVSAAPPLQDLHPKIKQVIAGIVNQREAEAWELANSWLDAAGEGTIIQKLKRLRDLRT